MNDVTQNSEVYLDSEEIEDQAERMEDNQGEMESMEWADVPEKRKQESLYTLFQKVWDTKNSSKVANLDKAELGVAPLMTVRDAQYLALLGVTLKHKKFAQFFGTAGEITLSTSASKKGWFTELFVSQKKFTNRSTSFGEPKSSSEKSKKWNIFGSKSNNSETPPE